MASAFVIDDIEVMIGMLFLVLVILKVGGIPIIRIIRGLKPVLILLTFTFVFQLLFVKGDTTLFDFTMSLTPINTAIMAAIILLWWWVRKKVKVRFLFTILTAAGIMTLLTLYTPGTSFSMSTVEIYPEGLYGALYIMTRLIVIITLSTILTLTTKPTDLNLGLEQMMKPLKTDCVQLSWAKNEKMPIRKKSCSKLGIISEERNCPIYQQQIFM